MQVQGLSSPGRLTKLIPILAAAITLVMLASRSTIVYFQPSPSASRGLAKPPSEAARTGAAGDYGKMPMSFELNQGQTAAPVKFLSRGRGYALFLTNDEAVLKLRAPAGLQANPGLPRLVSSRTPAVLRMAIAGARPNARVTGFDPLPGKSNYFVGNDPRMWRTDITNYSRVRYDAIYTGVDLVYYGNQGQLEYDFVVAPGADPKAIRLDVGVGLALSRRTAHGTRVPQAVPLRLDTNGDLVVKIDGGSVRFHKPVIYQPDIAASSTGRSRVEGQYKLMDRNQVSFEVGAYDRTRPLVIDPVLSYSSYLGGTMVDQGSGIAVDSSGSAYVVGLTTSIDFPTFTPFQPSNGGGTDAFVAKLNPAGTVLLYSTYLGGSQTDAANAVAVDSSGNTYVAGITNSTNFPTTASVFQAACSLGTGGTCSDAFVTKLNASGSALVYSTYLGGTLPDSANAIAVDAAGEAYVAGGTCSIDFPTTPTTAFQTMNNAGAFSNNAFFTKLNGAGTALVYSTYLGGSVFDTANSIAVDSSGNAYLDGDSESTNSSTIPFPVTAGAFQTTYGGGSDDGFVSKFNPTLSGTSSLVYSTYLGGTLTDIASGIAVDSSGNVYVAGTTGSLNFPTLNPIQAILAGMDDAFVTELNPTGSALVYSTYLGGTGEDNGAGIAMDTSGNAYIIGSTTGTSTSSDDFPIVNAVQPNYGGSTDAFVTEVSAAGSTLTFSTYLGGTGSDDGFAIAVDTQGNAYVTGDTASTDFPTFRPFQAQNNGNTDAFVARIGAAITIAFSDLTGTTNFDGSGKANLAVWRADTSSWYVKTSSGSTITTVQGLPGDIPVAGDYNGDGVDDYGVWRPSIATFCITLSVSGTTLTQQWGEVGDVPVPADYDGSGKANFAVWRPSTGQWIILNSNGTTTTTAWGLPSDVPAVGDYDGDGKADVAVWRPSNGTWYVIPSGGGPNISTAWGEAGDIPVQGDYDGDGKTDFAVWRPSNGTWYAIRSGGGANITQAWGEAGDIPVPGDYDADHKNDFAVWRPSNGTWYVILSGGGPNISTAWGLSGDVPATRLTVQERRDKHTANFDGDRKADIAVWRPSNTTWYVIPSSKPTTSTSQVQGQSGDILVPGDFDGDGKTDFAVWLPATGTWSVIPSSNPSAPLTQQWGLNGDIPVPGDYEGDGNTDFAVWRPSNGTWYVIPSSNPNVTISKQWGKNGDIPVPGDYDGDGKTDYAVWRPSNGTFYVIPSSAPSTSTSKAWGLSTDLPVPGDYDGDGKTDYAVWRSSNGTFYVIPSSAPTTSTSKQFGLKGDVPVPKDYDGDEKTDYAVWRPSNGTWYVSQSSNGKTTSTAWGFSTDLPANKPTGQ